MRVLLIHPNYHSGGAEIAGNWPPAWVAYLAGALKAAGYTDLRFIDPKNSSLLLVARSLSIRNSIASWAPIGLRMRRRT